MPAISNRGSVASTPKRFFWGGLVLLVLLATAASAAVFALRPTAKTVMLDAKPTTGQNLASAGVLPLSDDDGDGLQNWEEALFSTDPQNPDTDGDGTPDGEEIKQNRDPTAPGPDDRAIALAERLAKPGQQPDETNLTYHLAKRINEAIGPDLLVRIQQGNVTSEDLQELGQALTTLEPSKFLQPAEPIRRSELIVSPANDPAAVKRYFNELYAVYAATLVNLPVDDLVLLASAVTKNNFSKLQEIDQVLAAFDQSIRQAKAIPVPAGYEDFAQKELTYLAATRKVIAGLRNADRDPLTAMIMAQFRVNLMAEVRKFHQETGQALAQQGITFDTGEGGYQLFY